MTDNSIEHVACGSKCGRKMVWVKSTLLCVVCDAFIIWDLNTPWTIEEQNKWVENNIGRSKENGE